MAVTTWTAGQVLTAADLNDTLASKAAKVEPNISSSATATSQPSAFFDHPVATDWARNILQLEVGGDSRVHLSAQRAGNTSAGYYSIWIADNAGSMVQRFQIDNAGRVSGSGPSLGAAVAYTPTLTNFSLGNGTMAASYTVVGKRCIFRVSITFGSTSTFGSGTNWTISLPFTNIGKVEGLYGNLVDVSASRVYGPAAPDYATTTSFVIKTPDPSVSGAIGNAKNTFPFTWANGDIIEIAGIFETT